MPHCKGNAIDSEIKKNNKNRRFVKRTGKNMPESVSGI